MTREDHAARILRAKARLWRVVKNAAEALAMRAWSEYVLAEAAASALESEQERRRRGEASVDA